MSNKNNMFIKETNKIYLNQIRSSLLDITNGPITHGKMSFLIYQLLALTELTEHVYRL